MKNIESINERRITDNSQHLLGKLRIACCGFENNPTFATEKSTIAVKKPIRRFSAHPLPPKAAHPLAIHFGQFVFIRLLANVEIFQENTDSLDELYRFYSIR